MTRTEVLDKVVLEVRKQLGVGDERVITEDTHFVEDLNADSLDGVEIVMKIEDAFNTDIPEEESEQMFTVGSVVDWLVKNLPTVTTEAA